MINWILQYIWYSYCPVLDSITTKLNNGQRTIAIWQSQGYQTVNHVAHHIAVDPQIIKRLLDQFAQTKHVKDWPQSDKPMVTTPREDMFIRTYTIHNQFTTSSEVNRAWHNALPAGRQRISNDTVTRRLHQHGLVAHRPVIKQVLTPCHQAARLQWSVAH